MTQSTGHIPGSDNTRFPMKGALACLAAFSCALQVAQAQPTNLDLTGPAVSSGTFTYEATADIRAEAAFIVNGSAHVTFTAGQSVHLEPGFHATSAGATATFHAFIGSISQGPVISSLTPNSGPIGTQVMITGTNFGSSGTVTFFSGIPLQYASPNGASITVSVPSGTVTGPVTVTTGGATSNAVNFTTTAGDPTSITEYIRLGGRVIASETTIH